MKVATFTVRATQVQSERWKRMAHAEGYPSVGAWACSALDAYLGMRARAGRPIPLAWSRGSRFTVVLIDGREIRVEGVVSPPFGIYRGTSYGPDRNKLRTLVHIPTRRVIATLKSSQHCRTLAAELAPVLLRGELPEPAPIIERHARQSF